MESARRPIGRSLSKEPGLKKPRLAENPAAPDRSSNGRPGIIPRPVAPSSGGGGARVNKDRDSESSDSVRGPYQYQPGNQLHQELVNQYKTALAELTFNSKPIITNLTIIAGENAHAAKAIAATVCANILEVPREQKLPSLYLLDSIVKNIGKDYIKHFAPRLPEVFCKTYRQVDPSIHQGMRHLFGTWKGVFPPQTLQMIEKELGFSAASNGTSSGMAKSTPESQGQRPAHSIHVNPKYLEARQRLQTTAPRGVGSDTSGAPGSSHEDVEAPRRITTVSSERSLPDSYAKPIQHHRRDQVNDLVRDKISSMTYVDSEYGSSVSGRSDLGTGRVSEKFKEDAIGKLYNQKNSFDMKQGFESFVAHRSANSDSRLELNQNFASKSTNGMSRSWKNAEEEEYIWDEMNPIPRERSAAEITAHRIRNGYDGLDFDSLLGRPNIVLGVEDEASADSISTGMTQVASGSGVSFSWSEELHPPEGRMLSGPGKNITTHSGGHSTALRSSSNTVARTPFQTQLGPAHTGGLTAKFSTNVMPEPNVSMTQQRQTLGTAQSSAHPSMHHRPPSPSFSPYDPNQPVNNVDRNQTSIGPPTDPRRPPGQRNTGSRGQFSRNSLPLPAQDVFQSSAQGLQPQTLRSSSAVMPQQRNHVPSTQKRKLEESEIESSGEGRNFLSSQISGSESGSMLRGSSPDQSNPPTVGSSGQSITSSLLTAVVKSGILGSTSLMGSSTEPDRQVGLGSYAEAPLPGGPPANLLSSPPLHGSALVPGSSQEKLEQPPSPPGALPSSLVAIRSDQTPTAVNAASNPLSNLLSTLVAKGLISSSKSDPLLSASTEELDQPLDRGPGLPSTSSTLASSVPVAMSKPVASIADEPSSLKPAAMPCDDLPLSTTKIKNLIGFDFRPDIVRNLHPDVVSDLTSNLPHQCNICGLKLQLQERLERHMEWHALRVPEQKPLNSSSRRWYANSVDWVSGVEHFSADPSDMLGESGEALEGTQQMVPADEGQCACFLCGELFEDFYSRERNEWMFRGAVYLSNPSSKSHERIGTTSDAATLSPIVHVKCLSEDSFHALGLACDVKLEKDV